MQSFLRIMNHKKVVVGLSGGVDSSVAAYLLKQQGYNVVGVTMDMGIGPEINNSIKDAKAVAEVLGIEHHVIDFSGEFKNEVMTYFVNEYLNGRTPNPCNICNRKIKWEAMLTWAKEHGADYIATGHYARIARLENGRYAVANSATAQKDQTYALCNLTQEQLSHTLMPVGEYEKDAIRKIALEAGLPVAHKSDSQDICFIPDGDYAAFLQRFFDAEREKNSVEREENTLSSRRQLPGPGNYVDKEGNILGTHQGITNYTIGQRKGLNLAMGHPVFVTALLPETNEVVIGEHEDLFTTTLFAKNINFMGVSDFEDGEEFLGKIRYAHKGDMCRIYHVTTEDLSFIKSKDAKECDLRTWAKIVFEQPVRAVTPGQFVVLYRNEYVALGGTIVG